MSHMIRGEHRVSEPRAFCRLHRCNYKCRTGRFTTMEHRGAQSFSVCFLIQWHCEQHIIFCFMLYSWFGEYVESPKSSPHVFLILGWILCYSPFASSSPLCLIWNWSHSTVPSKTRPAVFPFFYLSLYAWHLLCIRTGFKNIYADYSVWENQKTASTWRHGARSCTCTSGGRYLCLNAVWL